MNDTPDKPSELRALLARLSDGGLAESDAARLNDLLRGDPEACEAYLNHMTLEAQLHREFGGAVEGRLPSRPLSLRVEEPAAGKPPLRFPRWAGYALAACLAVLAAAGAWMFSGRGARVAPAEPLATVGVVRGAVAPGDAAWRPGQRLTPGRVALLAGAMELTVINGVRLVLEGPGELEFLTPMRVVLRSGQAVVRVPEGAKGFQLETAGAQVVDLGTEFGMKCGPGGLTDVLVFDGEVVASSATDSAGFPHQLKAGMATRFAPGQPQPTSIAYRPERFVRRLPVDEGVEMQDAGFPFNAPTVEEVAVLPASRPITVDGDLSDWSGDGRFRSERSAENHLEGRMRYDAGFLYVAAQMGDPAPLRNVVDPATDGESGWRGGGLQIRLAVDPGLGWPVDANSASYYQMRRLPVDAVKVTQAASPALAHLTLWHYAPAAQNCLHIAYGMDFHGEVVNPPGYRAAFRKDADGRGYTLEYAIPWKLLNAPRAPRAGETLAMTWTAHWSDEGGRLWRGQWVELRNASEPVRIHTWERAATWGRAICR